MATSIFPDKVTAGGLDVRDGAGNPLHPPNVENAYSPPPTYASLCSITALPSDCNSRIEPKQINAIVSEMVSFAECMRPGGPWDCNSYHNLCNAFSDWAVKVGTIPLLATQPEAEAGADNLKYMSPLRTKQAIQNGPFFLQNGTGAVPRSFTDKSRERVSVVDFGAVVNDPSVDNGPAFQRANDYLVSIGSGGGIVHIPRGIWVVKSTVTISSYVNFEGEGPFSTFIATGWPGINATTDVTVFNLHGSHAGLSKVAVFGKGSNFDAGTFGATVPTIQLTPPGGAMYLSRVQAYGGSEPIANMGADDCYVEYCGSAQYYGKSNHYLTGPVNGTCMHRCTVDQGWPTGAYPTPSATIIPGWLASHPYAKDAVAIALAPNGRNYYIQCTVAGTSGTFPPTLKNYLIDIIDGGATWQLVCPVGGAALMLGSSSGEVTITGMDVSGASDYGIALIDDLGTGSGNGYSQIIGCTVSQYLKHGIYAKHGGSLSVEASHIAGGLVQGATSIFTDTTWGGRISVTGTHFFGCPNGIVLSGPNGAQIVANTFGNSSENDILINASATGVCITGNTFLGSPVSVRVSAGCDYYSIIGNTILAGGSIIDGGTGTHKNVSDNPGVASSTSLPGHVVIGDVVIGDDTATNPSIVFQGDSRTYGTGGSHAGTGGYTVFMTLPTYNGQSFSSVNSGVNSETVAGMQATAYNVTNPHYHLKSDMNVCVLWGGINDHYAGASGEQIYGNLASYSAHLESLGWRVIICTEVSGNGYDAKKNIINGHIHSNWPTFAHGLCDLAANPHFGPDGVFTDTTYYQDGVHMTDTGQALVASIVQAAVERLVANPGEFVPGGNLQLGANSTLSSSSGYLDIQGATDTYLRATTGNIRIGDNAVTPVSIGAGGGHTTIGNTMSVAGPVSVNGATVTDLATSSLAIGCPDDNSYGVVINNLTFGNGPDKGAYICQLNSGIVAFGVGLSVNAINYGAGPGGNDVALLSVSPSTSPSSGALKVAGGVGIGGALNVAGSAIFTTPTMSLGAGSSPRNFEIAISDANTGFASSAAQFPFNLRNSNNTNNNWSSISFYPATGYAPALSLAVQMTSHATPAADLNVITGAGVTLLKLTSAGALVVGNPTGGSTHGVGTVNATALYDDNVLLTCFGVQYLKRGEVDLAQWDKAAPSGTHALAHRFVHMLEEFDPRDPGQYIAKLLKDEALPGMPTVDEWQHGEIPLGQMVNRLWLAIELLASAFVGAMKDKPGNGD